MKNRRATKTDSLAALRNAGLNFSVVVDVGVQDGTPELLQSIPNAHHYLFEPVTDYNAKIRANYSNTRYSLVNLAVSSETSTAYLGRKGFEGAGEYSHAGIVARENEPGKGAILVSATTLDDFFSAKDVPAPCLLKVDVDGHEFEVLAGIDRTRDLFDCVIIECTLPRLLTMMGSLVEKGFFLWDVVDFCYYRSTLAQFDLVFLHQRHAMNAALLPLKLGGEFIWSDWQS